jgi:FkbM family methyltransferase
MMTNVIRKLIGYGQMRSQWLFRKLYFHAIYGMNYSNPNFNENGELLAIQYVCRALAGTTAPVVFDVGANVGEWSAAFLAEFGDKAAIHAFEPAAGTFAKLAANCAGKTGLRLHPFGLGSHDELAELYCAEAGSTIASIYNLPPDHAWYSGAHETISLRTLDGFCEENKIEAIDFLKIDVEGNELAALHGAARMLNLGLIRFVQWEFGFRQLDSRTFFRDFFQLLSPRYRIMRVVKDGLCPIPQYGEDLEVFVGVSNYLAERT